MEEKNESVAENVTKVDLSQGETTIEDNLIKVNILYYGRKK